MNQTERYGLKPLQGSYEPQDCLFLLQAIDVPMLSIEQKELLLQQGKQHYSQMVSKESAPSEQYLQIFHTLVEQYKHRLAKEIASLAQQIHQLKGNEVTLLSLARAGTPIGVLLNRALKYYYNIESHHYSISIVRDKGIDECALAYIQEAGHSAQSVLFVDGWTAKGVITQELKSAVAKWNSSCDYKIGDELCVISDIGGTADIVATTDDYAIPSGVLNSTVSGLVSRTILRDEFQGFHQCVLYSDLQEQDISGWFVDQISALFVDIKPDSEELLQHSNSGNTRHKKMQDYVSKLMIAQQVDDINKVKPGIAEATRVMLRRVPKLLMVRDINSPDIAHLLVLAAEKKITVEQDSSMPFNAIAIIANVF
ncbi:MAG: cysteine protease StiP family protein [Oceanospirillaceae bacterium]